MAQPIELYLVRHAHRRRARATLARRREASADRERASDGSGRSSAGLVTIGVEVDVVLTSPLLRAGQTADLLAEGLDPRPVIKQVDALAPGGTVETLVAALGRAKRARIACVGHEPDLGQLAAHLVGASQPFEFKKGGVCRIDLERASGPGRLVWLATPSLLRARA